MESLPKGNVLRKHRLATENADGIQFNICKIFIDSVTRAHVAYLIAIKMVDISKATFFIHFGCVFFSNAPFFVDQMKICH